MTSRSRGKDEKTKARKGKDEKEDKTLKHEPPPPASEFLLLIFTFKSRKFETLPLFCPTDWGYGKFCLRGHACEYFLVLGKPLQTFIY